MKKSETKRIWFAVIGAVFASAALVHQLVNLQLVNHEHYASLSKHNHIRMLPVAPVRGVVYDRNNRPLALNHTTYHLEVNPAIAGDRQATINKIRSVIPLSDYAVDKLHREWSDTGRLNNLHIDTKLSLDEVARLAVHLHAMQGVEIVGSLDRHYPHHDYFAHAIGYLGSVSSQDIRRFGPSYRHYRNIGKVGIERLYESKLRGKLGVQRTEVNAQGRLVRAVNAKPPESGADLMLALDMDLQRVAHKTLGDMVGAIVAIDPRNGDILAFVSKPAYDPNTFITGMSVDEYRAFINKPNRPLFNRAIQGQYAPGSTLKPIIALAGLENNIITPDHHIHAGPHYSAPGHTRKFRDWRKDGHGWVNARASIAQSCDVFFYDLAYRTGINRISAMMNRFGLGIKTGIDMDGEQTGLVPTREWKKREFNLPWFPEETINTGIGQGYVLTTPLQLAVITALLANRGRAVVPRMVRATRQGDGPWRFRSVAKRKGVALKNKNHWDTVINGMIDAVHQPNGTAYPYIGADLGYTMAGKTGTAQNYNLGEDEEYVAEDLSPHLRDHALFIGFAPVEDPQIAVAVIAENAGSGAKVAAPIARAVIDAYLLNKVAAAPSANGGSGIRLTRMTRTEDAQGAPQQ